MPPDWNANTFAGDYNMTYTASAATTVPYAMIPMVPVETTPEPVDDSSLAWLHDQVSEIIELAHAV